MVFLLAVPFILLLAYFLVTSERLMSDNAIQQRLQIHTKLRAHFLSHGLGRGPVGCDIYCVCDFVVGVFPCYVYVILTTGVGYSHNVVEFAQCTVYFCIVCNNQVPTGPN